MAITLPSAPGLPGPAQGAERVEGNPGAVQGDASQTGTFALAWPADSGGEWAARLPDEESSATQEDEPGVLLDRFDQPMPLPDEAMSGFSSLTMLTAAPTLPTRLLGLGSPTPGVAEGETQARPGREPGPVAGLVAATQGATMTAAPLSLLSARLMQQSQAATPAVSSGSGEVETRSEGRPLPLTPEARALTGKGELQAWLSQLQEPLAAERKEGGVALPERMQLLSPQEPQRGESLLPQVGKGMEWAPIKLANPQSQWGEQMLATLKERVEMQVNQHIKQAHIRLDPPELGRLELTVRLEGDRLSVQLTAANPALRDALIQSSERLRMSLVPQHAGGVDVNVGQGDRQQQGQSQEEESRILAGRRELRVEETMQAGRGLDRLNALV